MLVAAKNSSYSQNKQKVTRFMYSSDSVVLSVPASLDELQADLQADVVCMFGIQMKSQLR